MNENMKNFEELEVTEVEIIEEDPETSGNGVVAKVVTTLVVGGLGAFAWVKTKGKREARTIRNLEKKGYVVMKPEDFEATEEADSKDMDDAE